jgi:hypothetical protein
MASSSGSASSGGRDAGSAASSCSDSVTPAAGASRWIARRFSVSVPVLSLQMTVVEPKQRVDFQLLADLRGGRCTRG